ncbi:Na+/H+ antiporter subunit E [Cryobacterium sp. TMT1-21]|uniref:Na+/H+ antiporter subunit E n=1 Tax=unclassified Cryobacterium TaxID=2649013 RepID=UPI00106B3C37|nr:MULTISPECIES: Na+/H+ antiporter subunit E [unclassified Cryobacterium]TFD14708.1 Na+/H+ antiporter subunit E [Cryobacterium sp. TMT1-21]TFD22295.1 Na+/H+ antiporter subunit E [Cryobacterium sp. TMT2-23]TFD40935.1 Na+/H+ antiporter subunit E [Cryobacterium sp. TMT2-10]
MTTRSERLNGYVSRLTLGGGLVLLWMLLWGSFDWRGLVTGVLVAALVSVVFYLPAVQLSGRLNPWRTVLFFLRLLVDIVSASVQVAAAALSPRYRASNAILAVPLHTRSDLILTWTAVATSIVPGSLVVDIDRVTSTLYLHVLSMRTPEQIERFRASVFETERRIVLAFGSREDLERLRVCAAATEKSPQKSPEESPESSTETSTEKTGDE